MYDQCTKLSHEIQLLKNTSMLKAQVNIVTIDSNESGDKENKAPETGNVWRSITDLENELIDEKQRMLFWKTG